MVSDLVSWYLYSPPSVSSGPLKKAPTRKTKGAVMVRADIRGVLQRNIFCSDCEPISLDDLYAGKGKEPEKKVDSLEGAELLITMVSDNTMHSLAFVKVSKPEELVIRVSVGDSVGEAKVVTIYEKRMTFIKDGKELELSLIGEAAKPKDVVDPKKTGKKSPLDDLTSKIKKISENKYEIDRSVVQNLMTNIASAGQGARIMPDPKGVFRASFVRHYSLFYKLGIRSQDIIKSVNNIPLNSVQETLLLYTKLKNASHLTISVNRRGKTVNMDYTIR
ncbi:hypothetical protein KJ865_05505 [Myxococcota bacterium]|nr:hypothetical protein [Myxococcota bacterium]